MGMKRYTYDYGGKRYTIDAPEGSTAADLQRIVGGGTAPSRSAEDERIRAANDRELERRRQRTREAQEYAASQEKFRKEHPILSAFAESAGFLGGAVPQSLQEQKQVETMQRMQGVAEERQREEQRTGRGIKPLTTGQKVKETFKAIPRGAIESTAQVAGLAGVLGPRGEEFAKDVEDLGRRAVEGIGVGADEGLRFDPTASEFANLGSGVGSLVPFLLTEGAGAIAKGALAARGLTTAAKVAGATATAGNVALGTGQGATQARQQVEEYEQKTGQKVDPTIRQLVQLGGGAFGLTELANIPGIIARLPAGLRATATAKLANIAMKTGVGKLAPEAARIAMRETLQAIESQVAGRIIMRGAEEAGQEAASQFAQNVQERLAYNDEKDVTEDVASNAAMGFFVGAGVRGGVEVAQKIFPGKDGGVDKEAIRQELLRREPLASVDALIPDPDNPKSSTRGTLDILSAPNEDGQVVVRYGDGLLKRMHVKDIDALRVPEGAYTPSDSFSQEAIGQRLASTLREDATPAAKSAATALGLKLHTDLTLGRPKEAADYITKQEGRVSGVRRRQAEVEFGRGGIDAVTNPQMRVILEAKSILNDYRAEYGQAQAQPGVTVGEKPDTTTTLTQMLERNQQAQAQSTQMRRDLLKQIANDVNAVNKLDTFDDVLADHGLKEATPEERNTLLDIMRMESALETAEGADITQSMRAQQTERADIIEDALRRRNFDPEQKISLINAGLMRAQQEPLTDDELERVQKRASAENVFGPSGEFAAREEAVAPEEVIVPEQAAPEQAVPEEELAPAAGPETVEGVPVTKVAPGVARGVNETRRGMMGTQQGRPVEGAAELTPGMQDEQLLTERLETLRNNNMLSDQDIGDVLRVMRVPTTKADFDALSPSHKRMWEEAINKQLEVNQRGEELNAATNPKEKAKLKQSLEILRNQLDEMRGGIANAAGREAMARVTKRQNELRLIEADYKEGRITKKERDEARNALRIQRPMGPVLSIREDAVSELMANPEADIDTLELTEPVDIAEGTDAILAALDQAVADGKMDQEAADFTKWVLEGNPGLTRYASLFVSNNIGQSYAGQYDPISRLIEVVGGAPTTTATHEVLHHAERLMPEAAQNAIGHLWKTRLNLRRRFAAGDEKAFFDAVHDFYFGTGRPSSLQAARMAIASRDVPRSFYQYMSPSEFWAENASDILRQRYDVKDSILDRIRQWLKEFASHLGSFIGAPTRSLVIRNLNQLANTDGTSKSGALIAGNEGPAFMFGGRNATLRFDEQTQYDTARILAGMGNPAGPGSGIHAQTGWFMGPDGSWRFEFSDEGAKLTPAWDALPESKPLGDRHEVPLGEVLDHPLLYKYYPDAKYIPIRKESGFLDFGRTLQGSFNEKNNTLNITPYAQDPIGTIVHEIQHWVQGQEDFARGGNEQAALKVASEEQLERFKDTALSRLNAKAQELASQRTLWTAVKESGLVNEYLTANDALDKLRKDGAPVEERIAARHEVDAVKTQIGKLLTGYAKVFNAPSAVYSNFSKFLYAAEKGKLDAKIEDMGRELTGLTESIEDLQDAKGPDIATVLKDTPEAYEAYRSLFGEVEARTTASRREYGKAYREAFAPYSLIEQGVSPDNYIITRKLPGEATSQDRRNSQKAEEQFTSEELFEMLGDLGTNPNRPRVETVGTMAMLQKRLKGIVPSQSAIIRKMNYKYQDAVDFDKQLAAAYGVERLPANMSVANKAELHEAQKSGAHVAIDNTYVKPILRKMAELGVELQDIGMYLWARAAKDRNAMVAARNGLYPDGGSGLTEPEANSILRDFAMRGLTGKLDQIAKMHDNLVDHMLNMRVKEGLLTRKEANEQRAAQPFYAALKGWAADGDMQTEGDEEVHSDTEFRSKLGIKRSEFMKLEGRRSMPMNPLTNLFHDAHGLAQRVAVNRVGKAFLDNLINDPELFADVATYYTDSDPKIKTKRGPNVEQPEGIPVRTNMRMERDKYLVVKKNGVPYYVEFANTDAGQAMKRLFDNMSPAKLSKGWRAIVNTANFLKSLKTRYSPSFVPRSYVRDAFDAVVNAWAAETDKASPAFGKKLGAKVAAYMTPASKTGRLIDGAITRHLAGLSPDAKLPTNYLRENVLGKEENADEIAEMMLLLDQMIEDGGTPGHAVIHDTELLIADAEKTLKRLQKLKDKDPATFAKEGVRGIATVMDAASQFVDLRARMATYVAAIEAGVDREGAARLALSSSLDLTRRGEWAKTLDSLWFFFSPSVESARRVKRLTLNSSNGRKAIGTMMAVGALTSVFNMIVGAGDDDDDGKPNYLEIPDSVRQTSLVIMTGPKADDYVALPLGFMVTFPVYVGQKATEAVSGLVSEGAAAVSIVDAAKQIASAAYTTFAPVKPQGEDAQQVVTSMVPNIAKPLADLAINRNYFDTPIYQKQWDSDRASSTLGREDTGRVWKWIAKSVNEVSGGVGTAGTGLDFPPEGYRYLLEEYAGGPYKVSKDVVNFINEDNSSDKSLAQRLPIVRAYVGKGSEYAPMNKFFKTTEGEFFRPALSAFVFQRKNFPDDFARSQREYPFETSDRVLDAYKEAKSELDKLSRDRKADLAEVSDASSRREIISDYRARQAEVYKTFNKEYNAAKKEYEGQ